MLGYTQSIYLTEVQAEVEGDTFFPAWDPAAWRETDRTERRRDGRNAFDLAFVVLERIRPASAA